MTKSKGVHSSFYKKIVAAILCVALCLSITACGDTSYAYQVGEEKIPAGIYLLNQVTALNEAQSKEGFDSALKNVWDNKIEDQSLANWINSRAKDLTLEYVQVENMFEEKNFTLSDMDKESVDYTVSSNWADYEKSYTGIGISQESYADYVTNSMKKKAVFNSYYGPDGSEAVADATLLEHFKNDYAQIKILSFSTYDSTTKAAMTAEKKKEVETKANSYLERAKNGEDMTALINARSKEYAIETSAEAPVIDETQTYLQTIKKGQTSYIISDKLNTAIFEKAIAGGDPVLLSDDNSFYVVARYEINEDNVTADTRFALLTDLKSEDFDKIVADAAKELEVEANKNAIRSFKPEKLTKG